jgi:hypothetical protein
VADFCQAVPAKNAATITVAQNPWTITGLGSMMNPNQIF